MSESVLNSDSQNARWADESLEKQFRYRLVRSGLFWVMELKAERLCDLSDVVRSGYSFNFLAE